MIIQKLKAKDRRGCAVSEFLFDSIFCRSAADEVLPFHFHELLRYKIPGSKTDG
jgi:hypothetical protein